MAGGRNLSANTLNYFLGVRTAPDSPRFMSCVFSSLADGQRGNVGGVELRIFFVIFNQTVE